MNREIKFRAWVKRGGKNEMMYDCPFRVEERETSDFADGGKYTYIGCILSTPTVGVPLAIMQYTGLKDKNGKEIYEGDVVRYMQKPPHKKTAIETYSKVIYKGNCFCLNPALIRWNDLGLGIMPQHLTVIGNIYETPELLESKPSC